MLGIGSRIKHNSFGEGVVMSANSFSYQVCFIQFGIKPISKDAEVEIIEKIEANEEISLDRIEKSIIKIMRHWANIGENVELGDKWDGGVMILKPGDDKLKPKEIPIEQFFHKIVMIRDRIRVMEQRINASKISDEEKVNLQQYITRIYGSLTTFNVMFKHKEQQFIGEKS